MADPNLIFGGGFIGHNFANVEDVSDLLDYLTQVKINRVDSARLYPITNPGASETLLGDAKAADRGFTIDTKIKVPPTGDGRDTLSPNAIEASIAESFAALKVQQVNVLYCHTPDPNTPIEQTAEALNEHFKKDQFKKLGLANFSVEQVEAFVKVSEEKGYVKPSVYQGQYNAVCRRSEENLLPTLRKNGIAYNAYSPLAGGFLTGKLTGGDDLSGTRFEEGNLMGAFFKSMYDKPSMHTGIRDLQAVLKSHDITLTEASLRWIVYHSALKEGDGVTLGASSISHVKANTEDIAKGPLPQEVQDSLEKLWNTVKSEAPAG